MVHCGVILFTCVITNQLSLEFRLDTKRMPQIDIIFWECKVASNHITIFISLSAEQIRVFFYSPCHEQWVGAVLAKKRIVLFLWCFIFSNDNFLWKWSIRILLVCRVSQSRVRRLLSTGAYFTQITAVSHFIKNSNLKNKRIRISDA